MEPSIAQKAAHAISSQCTWALPSFELEAYSTTESATPTTLDLVPLARRDYRLRPREILEGKVHWLSPEVTSNNLQDRQEKLRGYLAPVCRQAGYRFIFTGNVKRSMNQRISSHQLSCSRYRKYEKMTSKRATKKDTRQQKVTVSRPLEKEDCCTCQFRIYFDHKVNRWFVPQSGIPGSFEHRGHLRVEPELVVVDSSEVSAASRGRVARQFSKHYQVDYIRDILAEEDSLRVTSRMIRGMKSKYKEMQQQGSAAERMLMQMSNNGEIDFTTMRCGKEESKCHIKTRTRGRPPKHSSTPISFADGHETAFSATERIFRAMSINDGQEFLMMAAWVDHKGLRLLQKSPEVLAFDVTSGVTSEKRPLLRGAALTRNHKSIPFFECFLPSESRWVFHWVFNEALPELLPISILSRVRLILTDEDMNCYSQLEVAFAGGVLPYATHRLCSWHKIDRNFSTAYTQSRRKGNDSVMLRLLHDWLFRFTRDVNSKKEWDYLMGTLETFIENSFISESLRTHTQNFLRTSFKHLEHKLSHHWFKRITGGDCRTTSFQECENAMLKRGVAAVRPNMALDESQDCIRQSNNQRYLSYREDYTRRASRTNVSGTDTENCVRDCLVPHCAEQFLRELSASTDFDVFFGGDKWKVRQATWCPVEEVFDFENATEDRTLSSFVIPQFDRTYTLSVVRDDRNEKRLVCSCGFYCRQGVPCRHMFRVMGKNADPGLCAIECRQDFLLCFNEPGHEEYTKIVESEVGRSLPGPLVTGDDIEVSFCRDGERTENWFSIAEDKLLLRPGQYHSQWVHPGGDDSSTLVSEDGEDGCYAFDDDAYEQSDIGPNDDDRHSDELYRSPKKASQISCELMSPRYYAKLHFEEYNTLTRYCQSADDHRFVVEQLRDLREALHSRHATTERDDALVSLPPIDNRHKAARLRPVMSPSKKKRRRHQEDKND